MKDYKKDYREGYTRTDELSIKRKMALSALKKAKEMEQKQTNRISKHLIVDGKHTVITFTGDNVEEKFERFCSDIQNGFLTRTPTAKIEKL